MTEAAIVLKAFQSLGAWLDRFLKGRADRTEREKQAIRELLKALGKTKVYLASLKRSDADLAEETRLVELWFSAASAFYGINPELAQQLELKGEYWTDPDVWSDTDVREAGIHIEDISEKAREILGEK